MSVLMEAMKLPLNGHGSRNTILLPKAYARFRVSVPHAADKSTQFNALSVQ